MINLSTDEMEDDQMDKNEKLVSIIIPISVALIFSLICGIGFYFFWGSFNLFGEQGFHHDSGLSGARWGVCLGIFGFSPLVITGVFALFKYKRQAKISLMIMIAIYACWSVIILAVSSYQNKKTIQYHQLATSTEIAERSIKRAKEGPVSPDRTRFIEYLGTNIWINEFTPTSYGGGLCSKMMRSRQDRSTMGGENIRALTAKLMQCACFMMIAHTLFYMNCFLNKKRNGMTVIYRCR